MRRAVASALALAAVGFACSKVPYTGRLQYNLVPDNLMRGLGQSAYKSILGDAKVRKKGDDAAVLQRVGRRTSKVANKPKYDWEYKLLKDEEVNAWCLPGGKIGFYEGILPVLRNEAGMAFVMGHEVGHATAHHGAERLSQQLTVLGGIVGLEIYMANATKVKPRDRALILGALGVGATLGVLLPFSRMHESEADVIGMMYMANAGYPPGESIKVWDRMAKLSGGGSVPTFLSTHPSHKKRQENQREWMPKAKKRHSRNALKGDTRKTLWGGGSAKNGPKKKSGADKLPPKSNGKVGEGTSGRPERRGGR